MLGDTSVWCLELYLANAVDELYDVVEKDLGCLLLGYIYIASKNFQPNLSFLFNEKGRLMWDVPLDEGSE